MGTDIHPYVEVRDGAGWRLLQSIDRGELVTSKPAFTREGDGWIQTLPEKRDASVMRMWDTLLLENGDPIDPEILLWNGRCYDLFAVLANVRNGYGFAGVPTGSGFRPIDMPRGVPDDIAPDNDIDERGYHSCSWLSIDEILAYDWSQTTEVTGLIDHEDYAKWYARGRQGFPDSWCGSVGGHGVVHISEEEMIDIVEGNKRADPSKTYYTRFLISTTYRDTMPASFFKMCEQLRDRYGEGNVRLVFGFDS